MRTTLVCSSRISARAVWLSPVISTMMCRREGVSSSSTVQTPWASIWRVASRSAGPTLLSTSRPSEALPASAPSTALVSMPRMLPVVGTITPLAFLIMLPLHFTTRRRGSSPSTSRALAAASAMAMGSVQPSAGTSSRVRIRT